MIKRSKKFLSEVQSELKKVAWPSREELKGSTIVVLAITFLLGLYIGVLDFIFSKIVTFLIR